MNRSTLLTALSLSATAVPAQASDATGDFRELLGPSVSGDGYYLCPTRAAATSVISTAARHRVTAREGAVLDAMTRAGCRLSRGTGKLVKAHASVETDDGIWFAATVMRAGGPAEILIGWAS